MVDYDSDGDEAYFIDLLYRFDDEHVVLERVRDDETKCMQRSGAADHGLIIDEASRSQCCQLESTAHTK
jgi:hypothetical protein